MLKNLSIRSKLALIAVLPILAMAVLAGLAWSTINAVKVGGPAEQRVNDAKDVVADVLPPPLFTVETLLVIEQASHATDATARTELVARYETLKGEYTTNHDKWTAKGTLPPAVREALQETSYASAMALYGVIDREIVPLLRSGDLAGAEKLLVDKAEPMFAAHRADILQVIERAQAYEAAERADVASSINQRTVVFVLGLVLAGVLTLVLGLVVGGMIRRSIERLRRAAEEDLPRALETLGNADDEALADAHLEPIDLGTKDELADAADAFNAVLNTAVGLAAQQTLQRRHTSEMFVNLGRRNQNLVARQLKFLDGLERTETDGDRLAELFRLDNLATRMRRNAESLLVLAGVEAPRRWRKPVRLYDVVRAAIAEIEDFRRVEFGSFDDVQIQGSSVANVTHLVAELVENATRFSPPDTVVTVNGVDTGTGFLLGIHDHGLGMPADQLASANERLHTFQRLEEVPTAYLGLFVVARLAQREGIDVELESPDGDGLSAWVRIPVELLGANEATPASAGREGLSRGEASKGGARRMELAARADKLPSKNAALAPAAAPDAGPSRFPSRRTAPAAAAPADPVLPPPSVDLKAPVVGSVPPAGRAEADDRTDRTERPARIDRPARPERAETIEKAERTAKADTAEVIVSADDVSSTLGGDGGDAAATKSGFKKRAKATAKVEFDRFADRPAPTGNRSAEDMKDRLDRFSAGKRFATARTNEADQHAEDSDAER